MIKVLHIGKFYPIQGGVEKVMFDIVSGLSERDNIKCDMLCASLTNKGRIFDIGHSKIICTSTWIKAFATMISPAMIMTLKRIAHDYDIIHIHHPDPMATLALRLSGFKGKVVLHWHADIMKQKIALKLYKPLQKWLIRRADVIVGTTPKYLQISPFLQDSSLKKICIPIGIEPMKYDSKAVDRLKKKFDGKKIIFSLGRLVEYKGYQYLIEAASYLSDDFIILIGGNGPLKQSLEYQIQQLGVSNKVKLLGRISDEDLPTFYGMCDVYVLSSIWKTEAFGIVQIEAMSCGKPVIATHIEGSGVDWVNEDGVSGLNVNPKDAKGIAEAINRILKDKEQYEHFSHGARLRYKTLFRKEVMINSCLNLYASLQR